MDVGLFFGYRHHQRGDEVKRGNNNDAGEQQGKHPFFHFYGGKIAAVVICPILHPDGVALAFGDKPLHHGGGVLRVGKAQA